MSHPFPARSCTSVNAADITASACALCAEWNEQLGLLAGEGVAPAHKLRQPQFTEYDRRYGAVRRLLDLCWRMNESDKGDAAVQVPCVVRERLNIFDQVQERLCDLVEAGRAVDAAYLELARTNMFRSTPRLVACAERALGMCPALGLLLAVSTRMSPERLPIADAAVTCALQPSTLLQAIVAQMTGAYVACTESMSKTALAVPLERAVQALDLYAQGVTEQVYLRLAAQLIERCDLVINADVVGAIVVHLDAQPWTVLEHPAAAERVAAVLAAHAKRGERGRFSDCLGTMLRRARARFEAAYLTSDPAIVCAVLLSPAGMPTDDSLYECVAAHSERLSELFAQVCSSKQQENLLSHRIGMYCYTRHPSKYFLELLVQYAHAAEALPGGLGAVPDDWWEDVATLISSAPAALDVPPDVLRRACASYALPASQLLLWRVMGVRRAKAYIGWRTGAQPGARRAPLSPAGRVRHALLLEGAPPADLELIDDALARWGGRSSDLVAAYRAAPPGPGRAHAAWPTPFDLIIHYRPTSA